MKEYKFTQAYLLLLGLAVIPLSSCVFSVKTPNSKSSIARPAPSPQEIVWTGEVRSLPGTLDKVPLFSSNSPEWVKTSGILLSTFPPQRKKVPNAHLNFPLQGRFDLFAHHFTHTPKDLQTLYLGVIVRNPSQNSVKLTILQAASYLLS